MHSLGLRGSQGFGVGGLEVAGVWDLRFRVAELLSPLI